MPKREAKVDGSTRVVPTPPSDDELRALLGRRYAAYVAFLEQNAALRPEWKYYGAKSGWSLKLFEKKRNLCFVMPRTAQLQISFLLGKEAVAAALASSLPETLKQELRAARAYVEGTPAHVRVDSKRDLAAAQLLLEIKRAS